MDWVRQYVPKKYEKLAMYELYAALQGFIKMLVFINILYQPRLYYL